MQRSHYCNLTCISKNQENVGDFQSLIGTSLTVNGWIKRIRRHGTVIFLNLRDRYSDIQVTIDTDASPELATLVAELRIEFCIACRGILQVRPQSMQNLDMATGTVEILLEKIQILNSCPPLPFMLQKNQLGESDGGEALRLKYRYLDLRSDGMQYRMILRHRLKHEIHGFLNREQFLEIETPTLIRSMPEGARDYLVPSRIHPGKFYALPQSPQLYKQLLMIGGLDRYYQIARCYRDEDARGDRQPEFTQLDLEMSFASAADVQQQIERLLVQIWENILQQQLQLPFPCLSYEEAMNRYGSDKPDLRNPLQLQDFADFAQKAEFSLFQQCLQAGGSVKVLVVPQAGTHCTRKVISHLEEEAKKHGAKGLAWTRVSAEASFDGGIGRFFQGQFVDIAAHYRLQAGDILFFSADRWDTACQALGAVRRKLGEDLKLIDKSTFAFAWIVNFPMFLPTDKESPDAGTHNTGWAAAHHMFCMPCEEYLDNMEEDPGKVYGNIYDLVVNGYELGSGSVRIHCADIQERIFAIVGYSKDLFQERFGFILEALRYGAPPHSGIALGLDRLAMIMAQKESIKEVIAFPKNNLGQSLLDASPEGVSPEQLADLRIASLPPEPQASLCPVKASSQSKQLGI